MRDVETLGQSRLILLILMIFGKKIKPHFNFNIERFFALTSEHPVLMFHFGLCIQGVLFGMNLGKNFILNGQEIICLYRIHLICAVHAAYVQCFLLEHPVHKCFFKTPKILNKFFILVLTLRIYREFISYYLKRYKQQAVT